MSVAPEIPAPDEASVGKYSLIASLGKGGMADVYLAVVSGPLGINKLQTVKRLRREHARDPERLAMFLDEARVSARVNHPNVVQTFEVGAFEGVYFIAMEYLEGAPLNRILSRARSHPPPDGVLLRVIADTLAGLHHVHELTDYDGTLLHVVHRDASPHNILVTYDGQTKLLDFGIATSDASIHEPKSRLTGKLTYMAPEQARSKPLDRRADIFTMGITLWEALAGRKMWGNAGDMEILTKLATGAIPKLQSVRKGIPAALVAITEKALAPEPSSRYATAAEMRADLQDWLDKSGHRVSSEDIGQYVTDQFGDKRVEIQKAVEKQLGKLSGPPPSVFPAVGMGPDSSDPASLARMHALPIDLFASGFLPSIPSYGSMAPSGPNAQDDLTPLDDSIFQTSSLSAPEEAQDGPSSGKASRTVSHVRSAPPKTIETLPAPAPRPAPEPAPTPADVAMTEPPAPSRAPIWIALAVVVLTALGVFVALRLRQNAHRPQTLPSQVNIPAEVTVASKPNVPKTSVELQVRAVPASAKIYLDGAPLDTNPFSGTFPVDDIGHRLRAEAPDHNTAAEIVMFDKDHDVELVLTPKAEKNGKTP